MAYSTDSPPVKLVDGVMGGGAAGRGGAIWYYASTDTDADVDATDYFSNGDDLGMKLGDVVLVVETDASYLVTLMSVTAVTAGGAATVTAGTVTV